MTLTWYCVRTERAREEMARDAINRLPGVVVRLPIFPVIRGRGDDRKRVDLPLIPRHLLVGIREGENRFAEVERARAVIQHESGRTTEIELTLSFLRLTPASSPAVVRIADMARLEAAEGEMIDAVEARLAEYRDEALRRARRLANPKAAPPDDTDELIERLKSTAEEERVRALYEMLGRGSQARLKLADLQRVA